MTEPTSKIISIIDYGMGNIGSVANMIKKAGGIPEIISQPESIYAAQKLLLPGVGAFDAGITRLKDRGLYDCIIDVVNNKKVPILGICLGIQLLFGGSEEGDAVGLNLIEGEVRKFIPVDGSQKVPHMAWNEVSIKKDNPLMEGLAENRFYFVHSYFIKCADSSDVLGETHYINDFVSMVQRGNVYGAQFHPEKSHKYGLRLFQNYLNI